jgi:tetratricopeptide (TPR) repeat protein
MVLNNIGCCRFSEGNHKQAWVTFLEARDIQQKTAQADLDLLHVAITLSNLGYVLIQMRQYEQAQEVFEEALLVSLVVLLFLSVSCLTKWYLRSFNNRFWMTGIMLFKTL